MTDFHKHHEPEKHKPKECLEVIEELVEEGHKKTQIIKGLTDSVVQLVEVIGAQTGIIKHQVRIIDRLTHPGIPENPQVANQLKVSRIKFNNSQTVNGTIMSVTFKKAQKVTATITGFNSLNPNAPINSLTAVSGDTSLYTIGAIDQATGTVEIIGVNDGNADITYSAKNINNDVLTLVDQVIVADEAPPELVATSLSVNYSTPVDQ